MTGRHSDEAAFDGCRQRTNGLACGHSPAAHDCSDGGCSLCLCPRYQPDYRPAFLVLGVLALIVGALVLILTGAHP